MDLAQNVNNCCGRQFTAHPHNLTTPPGRANFALSDGVVSLHVSVVIREKSTSTVFVYVLNESFWFGALERCHSIINTLL